MQDHVNYSKFSIFYFELLKNWCYKMANKASGQCLDNTRHEFILLPLCELGGLLRQSSFLQIVNQ